MVKVYNLYRALKTIIIAELAVMSSMDPDMINLLEFDINLLMIVIMMMI